MRKDREVAIKLRGQNKSYNEISRTLGISKSTLCFWFKGLGWSEEIKDGLAKNQRELQKSRIKLMTQANKEKWKKWHETCREKAVKEFSSLKNSPLFISGLMLYWGEGDKNIKNCVTRITNSEPEMIKIFCLFLKKVGVAENKIYSSLLLYPDLLDEPQKKFWSRTTGLSLNNFKKSRYIRGRHPTRRLSYGVCSIAVNSRELKEKIFKWLELYRQELLNTV